MDEFRAQVPNAGRAHRHCGTCCPKPPISRVKRRRLKLQTRREVARVDAECARRALEAIAADPGRVIREFVQELRSGE